MKQETAMAILYLLPASVAFRTLALWSKNYARLPEKIPMQFNLAGQPDGYWKKRPAIVYFFPATSLLFVGLMFFAFFHMPVRANGFIHPEMAVAGLIMSFAVVIVFHSVSRGIIAYTLGKAKSIRPFLKLPFILVILASLNTVALPFVTLWEPELVSVTLSTRADARPAQSSGAVPRFRRSDLHIYAVLEWKHLNKRRRVSVQWAGPDRRIFKTRHFNWKGNRIVDDISPVSNAGKFLTGAWTVRVYLWRKWRKPKWKRVAERRFDLLP